MKVEELLQSKNIEYTPQGGDFVIRCLNSEHPDRHPSLRVDRITGIYNCFSCAFKGNIFTFFGEQVNQLQLKRDLLKKKINNKVAESIGLTNPLGCMAYEGDWRNIKPETYKKFNAFLHHAPEFLSRLVIPITDISGKITAFNARHMSGGSPKYLITPPGAKMPLFPQSVPILGTIILVEGIFDMLNLHDKGLTNAVCCHGTKLINENKLSLLKFRGVDRIDIFMDGDEAGQDAAEKIKKYCDNLGLTHRNIYFKDTDPGALTHTQVQNLKEKLYAN